MAPPPGAGVEIPAVLVVLVVVAPAKVAVVVVQPTEMTVADRNPARTAAAVVVVLVLAAGTQTVSTKLVTAETVHRLRLAGRLLREPVVEEEEAARRIIQPPLALQPEAANGRVMVVVEAAVPAVPVGSTVTGLKPAAAQTAPRTPASQALLILVAALVVAPLVA